MRHSLLSGSLATALAVSSISCGGQNEARSVPTAADATYVGRAACVDCHRQEADLWTGSDHDLAMDAAGPGTVLGDFDGATFAYARTVTRFSMDAGAYRVRADGTDGAPHDFSVAYTFGVRPLQQYLLPLPGGRLQALSIAWDARPTAAGGQRWFHLYPDGKVDHRDVLHWTGPAQNWNSMCAECHSTNVRKNWRDDREAYETTWSENDVSCEACHGPGSTHVAWARSPAQQRQDATRGLQVILGDGSSGGWVRAPGAPTARRTAPRDPAPLLDSCGRCHSRRSQIAEDRYDVPLADTHRVALLEEGLYEDDGQIRDEVYEYGSFVQSAMYRAGVACTDCHDPHSVRLHAQGNDLCARCHLPDAFDTPSHHHHPPGGDGARCVDCHMAQRFYMVVDGRRDHSFRVPRPDLSAAIGTPNACNDCHRDRSARWAAAAVESWGGVPKRPFHFGAALHAARHWMPAAGELLLRVVNDPEAPAIARAAALVYLPWPGAESATAIERAAADADALVRRAAAQALDGVAPQARLRVGAALIADPVRTVRLETVPALAGAPPAALSPEARVRLDAAIAEYRQAQAFNADRAESWVNLGNLEVRLGHAAEAESAFRHAIRRQPSFVPGAVNLADLYRGLGREAEAEKVLRDVLARVPENAAAHHALGLALVRQRRSAEALVQLQTAAALDPEDPRFAYVFAVALHDSGDRRRARVVLEAARQHFPAHPEIQAALRAYAADR